MTKKVHELPRNAYHSRSLLRCSSVFLLSAAAVVAQSRIIRPDASNRPVISGNRYVATLRSSDSPEGSRVTITSRVSLNDYEAYRRGDRFYVKIPAAEVPRAETLRGRGFSDVKVQRVGDSVVISFRLTPGGTAHVEQSGNALQIVFAVPGARVSTAANGTARVIERPESTRRSTLERENTKQTGASKGSRANKEVNSATSTSTTSPFLNSKSKVGASTPSSQKLRSKSGDSLASSGMSASKSPASTSSPASSGSTQDGSSAKSNEPSGSSGTSETKPASSPQSLSLASPNPSPSVSATASQNPSPSVSATVQRGSLTAASSPTVQPTSGVARSDETNQVGPSLKERLRYWILLAQLNPIPMAIALGVLLLIIALLFARRRRAKQTRVTAASKPQQREVPVAKPEAAGTESVSAKTSAETSAVTAVAGSSAVKESKPELPADEARRELVARVGDEARKATAGGEYDQSVIGSSDRETRQLVGAELLAALVGRDAQRRERAREAFMKHGYFDDATRDLRVGESANERAAAARRLSFVNDREATPHLIGALEDSSPDVRRAAVEALTDLHDPAAIPPLNALMRTENDPKVPRSLIKHAIDACATSAPEPAAQGASSFASAAVSQAAPAEREVIEL